ncbi:alpha/beta hydrolase [Clostridium grantii]|uniref:Alpha/beta hydrolase family protein n=1 Tax=Clostridium grantii DSM 8605 TaxID=1121316 RepID=A0A1M5X1S5_9CLOT|nr:alpha/beta hydrolase [Clostridium grantii]SHH93424.1 Alpha/beta hydrolase family protein [Clostridium grantii DSM 8605]
MVIEIKGQTIHYNILGNGLPLIILHGLYLDSISMIRAVESPSVQLQGFKRIYIDMPGMGQSPRHELENNSDTMLDLLCELITVLINDHPFIVIGYSYGGYIAQGIAKRFLHQIIGEVLICPVIISQPEKRIKTSVTHQDIDENFFNSLDEKTQKKLLTKMVVINERTYHRSEADFSRAIALADKEFLKELAEKQYSSTYIESNKSIHQHKSLIFLGYQDTSVGYQDMLDRLYIYPNATVNLLSNASHSN